MLRSLVRGGAHRPSFRSASRPSFAYSLTIAPQLSSIYHQWRTVSRKARKQREKDRRHSEYINWVRDQKRKRNLHPAAQWKRILSSLEFWWSAANLPTDAFLKEELRKFDGWCRLKTLLKFRKFVHWVTQTTLSDALTSSAATKWELKTDDNGTRLVRRKNVTLAKIEAMELAMEADDLAAQDQAMGLEMGHSAAADDDDDQTERSENKKRRKKLPKYTTTRKVVTIQKPAKIASFCENLIDSVQRCKDKWGEEGAIIGLDVEYATLEFDIRQSLPAMLQLSSPMDDGPVGLIWLDKLPDHGKSMLFDEKCKPLLNLLEDSSIEKVGVNARSDVSNLVKWWGISDRAYANLFVGGVIDLEEEPDPRVQDRSLEEMCDFVLGRRLMKRKTNRKDEKKSHWRAAVLTKAMKEYAANDVACGVDIWMVLNNMHNDAKS